MTAYVASQLDYLRTVDNETCPGEDRCETEEKMVIFTKRLYGDDRACEEICQDCKLLKTKPGQEPPHLTLAIVTANELDGLKEAGAVFPYPDALSAFEWTCIEALNAGRALSKANEHREEQDQREKESKRGELDAIRRRRGR